MASFAGKFDSNKQDWTTPPTLFARLDAEFHFTIDLAASADNAKCATFYCATDNALTKDWRGVGWCNPPYGAKKDEKLSDWVRHGWEQSRKHGSTVVMFIPARTNTRWFHRYCMQAKELRFIEGRPRFGDAPHGLPQPLVLVVFGPRTGEHHPLIVSSYKA